MKTQAYFMLEWFDFIFILEELFLILFNRKILYANLLYKMLNKFIVFHSCLHYVYNDNCVASQGSINFDHSTSPLCDKHKLWLWDSFMKILVWLTVFRNRASLHNREKSYCMLTIWYVSFSNLGCEPKFHNHVSYEGTLWDSTDRCVIIAVPVPISIDIYSQMHARDCHSLVGEHPVETDLCKG